MMALSQYTRLASAAGRRRVVVAPQRLGSSLNKSLEETDKDIFDLIEHEKRRQRNTLGLIASENVTSRSVLDALGSVMSNK